MQPLGLADKLKLLPHSPGVYLYFDDAHSIIYVGKALDLKNRVFSYFQQRPHYSSKIESLVDRIHDLDIIKTDTEVEALLLENTLIRKHQPKYNSRLKDDKHFPYIKITNELFGRVVLTRKRLHDQAAYYGPYTSMKQVNDLLEVIHSQFQLRRCHQVREQLHACIYFHLHQCAAPCQHLISQIDYAKRIAQVHQLLHGHYHELMTELAVLMEQASQTLSFENAAQYRDQINALKQLSAKQKVDQCNDKCADYIVIVTFRGYAIFQVFHVINGDLTGKESFPVDINNLTPDLLLQQCLEQYYGEENRVIPEEIVLEYPPHNIHLLAELFMLQQKKLVIIVPKIGLQFNLLELVKKNGMFALRTQLNVGATWDYDVIAEKLQQTLGLAKIPERIIGMDVSHLSGTNIVASAVLFEHGQPCKSGYRRFNIKSVLDNNDVACLKEMVTRYFSNTQHIKPDLLLIDGGKCQLNAVSAALIALSYPIDFDLISIAKKEELLHIYQRQDSIQLGGRSHERQLLQRVRDEAHRFAITFQRSKRKIAI